MRSCAASKLACGSAVLEASASHTSVGRALGPRSSIASPSFTPSEFLETSLALGDFTTPGKTTSSCVPPWDDRQLSTAPGAWALDPSRPLPDGMSAGAPGSPLSSPLSFERPRSAALLSCNEASLCVLTPLNSTSSLSPSSLPASLCFSSSFSLPQWLVSGSPSLCWLGPGSPCASLAKVMRLYTDRKADIGLCCCSSPRSADGVAGSTELSGRGAWATSVCSPLSGFWLRHGK
mmetsp:Transcript_64002/g.149077  ORF Transcript_64002/g.149077 Transcript_64002/m.149077 type:complete len:234 (+) Transcript_64002:46-747(+)